MSTDHDTPKSQNASPIKRRRFLKMLGGGGVLAAGAGALLLRRYGGRQIPASVGALPAGGTNVGQVDAAAVQAIADLNIRTLKDLDRLPWFKRREDGMLVLRDDLGIPAHIDIHAHVGWRHGSGQLIDMEKRCPVEYLYDFERDQDVLFEQIHPAKDEGRDLTLDSVAALVRTPPSNLTHTAANLIAEMDAMKVKKACMLPIEIPVKSHHAHDTLNALAMDDRFMPFGGVYPQSWGSDQEDRLAQQKKDFGIRGIKYHPVFQFTAPDDDDAMAMLEYCVDNDLIVMSHIGYTGGELSFMRNNSQPYRLERALEAFPTLRIVCLHTGVRMIDETLAVARKFPEQVWLGISGQPVPNITYILERYDHERILYGSDWPFYPLSVMLARALTATEGRDELRQRVLHDNAAKLLGV